MADTSFSNAMANRPTENTKVPAHIVYALMMKTLVFLLFNGSSSNANSYTLQ